MYKHRCHGVHRGQIGDHVLVEVITWRQSSDSFFASVLTSAYVITSASLGYAAHSSSRGVFEFGEVMGTPYPGHSRTPYPGTQGHHTCIPWTLKDTIPWTLKDTVPDPQGHRTGPSRTPYPGHSSGKCQHQGGRGGGGRGVEFVPSLALEEVMSNGGDQRHYQRCSVYTFLHLPCQEYDRLPQ